jgi:hypothetical protein
VEEPEKKPGMDSSGAGLFLFGGKQSEGGERRTQRIYLKAKKLI